MAAIGREIGSPRLTKGCYHWHYIFLTLFVILYSEPYFCFSTRDGGHAPFIVVPKTVCPLYSLAAFRIWLNLSLYLCISCHYIVFSTPTHFSWRFSIHVIHFRCTLVYTGGISCLEIDNSLSKVNMQHIIKTEKKKKKKERQTNKTNKQTKKKKQSKIQNVKKI